MKQTKSTVGLLLLIFLLNTGIFAQREGALPNINTQESLMTLGSSSATVETSMVTETPAISYERNQWELESMIQRDTPREMPIDQVKGPSYSISSVQYVPHSVIQIDGNADFLAYNFTGRGTMTEPYIIANYSITAAHTHLIFIRNTDAYFEIRGNLLDGINNSYNAIFLRNVTNGFVKDNVMFNVEIGVYLEGSYYNTIDANLIYDVSVDGVNLWASSYNDILYNEITNADVNGISVSDACNSTVITGNQIMSTGGWAGIYLGGSYDSWVNNNIITSVYDGNGITLGYWGMSPRFTYATINNNTISSCKYRGIRVEFANENTITKNTIHHNGEDGIDLWASSYNIVELNNIFHNNWDGILIDAYSEFNQFYNNVLTNNSVGITNWNSSNNEFFGNGIYDSRYQGFLIDLSDNLDIFFNSVLNSWGSGILAWGTTSGFNIGNNTLSMNSRVTLTNPELYGAGIYVNEFGGIISGNIVTDNHHSAIYIEVGSRAQIYGNEITGNGFTGISLINGTNTGIDDNKIIENGGNGIFCLFSDYNTITNNDIMGNGGNGIFLIDSNFNTIEFNEIAGNLGVIANPLPPDIKFSIKAVTSGHGVFLDPCIGNVINSNNIHGNAGSGTYLLDSSGTEISDNEILDNNENGVFLEGSSNNHILRNHIASNGDPELLQSISKGEISLKVLAVTSGHGVFLDPTSQNIVSDNIIENNIRNGVHLYQTDDSYISNNEISGNENGLVLEDSNWNNISTNTIFENGMESTKRQIEYPFLKFSIIAVTSGHGVFLDPSDFNVLEGNNIFKNTGDGIFLVDSDNTKILNNILSVNLGYGVNVDPTSGATVVANNDFFENKYPENLEPTSQARDDGLDSFFDHNYWSDWIGEGSYLIDGTAGTEDNNPADSPNISPWYSFSNPTVIYPNGGEGVDGLVAVQWENIHSAGSPTVNYWLFYSRNGGSSWVSIPMATYDIITAADNTTRVQYMWDTTTVANSNDCLIKVVAVDGNGFSTLDTSDNVFAIKNEGGTTTTTTETKTETGTTPQISPSWSYIIAVVGFTLLFALKTRKRNRL